MTVDLLYDKPTRRHHRVTLRGRVHLRLVDDSRSAETEDSAISPGKLDGELVSLSKGGAFIAGIPALPVGTEVDAFVLVPHGGAPIPVRARAIYNLSGDRRRQNGTGFLFVAASHFAHVRLKRAMVRLINTRSELLYQLAESDPDTHSIRALCEDLGLKLPAERRSDRLRWRALHAVNEG